MSLLKEGDYLLTLKEASDLLSVHTNTIRLWCKTGKISYYRVGPRRDRRLRYSDVIKFLEERSPEQ